MKQWTIRQRILCSFGIVLVVILAAGGGSAHGSLEPGERPGDALRREVAEELGTTLDARLAQARAGELGQRRLHLRR